jgi:hypothetical protein
MRCWPGFINISELCDKAHGVAPLRAQAQAGEINLAYFEEAGFEQVHPNCNKVF